MSCVKCRDCKHWKQVKLGVEKYYNVHDEKKEDPMFSEKRGHKHILPFGNCKNKMLKYDEAYSVNAGTGNIKLGDVHALYYMDSEQYGAFLMVGANFGCIHGEQ